MYFFFVHIYNKEKRKTMNLHELIQKNMVRFRTKNLSEETIRLFEQVTEPDLKKYDWSNGEKDGWSNAPIDKIIDYVIARDSGKSYSQYAIYMPIMNWFRDHDSSETRNSLYIWLSNNPWWGLGYAGKEMSGMGGMKYPSGETADNLIQQDAIDLANNWKTLVIDKLKGPADLDGKVKAQLNRIPVALTKTAEAGIILSVTPGKNTGLTLIKTNLRDLLTKPGFGSIGFLPDGGYTAANVAAAKTFADTIIAQMQTTTKTGTVDKTATGNNVYADDTARSKILGEIQKQCKAKMNDPQFRDHIRRGAVVELSWDKIVKEADYVTFSNDEIKAGGGTTAATNKQIQSGIAEIFQFQFPKNDANFKRLQENFFEDDGVSLTSDSKDGIDRMWGDVSTWVRQLQKEFPNDPVDIQSITVFSYASTSTVNSGYGTGTAFKSPKKYNKGNNVVLGQARLKAMVAETLAQGDARGRKEFYSNFGSPTITANQGQLEPNHGPEWDSVGGSNYGQTYDITSYGALFQAAYEKDKTLTPHKFYAGRDRNENLKAEYESVYSGFRMSSIGLIVQAVVPQSLKDQEVEGEYAAYAVGDFHGAITWTVEKNKKKRRSGGKTHYNKAPKGWVAQFGPRGGTGCSFQ
jgi:hypothetical protein